MRAIAMLLLVGCASTPPAVPSPPPGPTVDAAPPKATAVIPANANPGPRDLAAVSAPLGKGLMDQPFGQSFIELQPENPPPSDKTGLAKAETHPALENDAIESQAQVQFLEETDVEARFGVVSLRVVRQYRFGKLQAAQLVLDRIGEATNQAAFLADLATLAAAWADPAKALGVAPKLRVARNDLAPLKSELPLRIVFEPEGQDP